MNCTWHNYRVLAPDVDTVFLTTSLEYAYLSSTTVKEVASFGGDTRSAPVCCRKVKERLGNKSRPDHDRDKGE